MSHFLVNANKSEFRFKSMEYEDVGDEQDHLNAGVHPRVSRTDEEEEMGAVEVPHDLDDSFSWKKLWAYTGPGALMSIAYLDPGNLESDLQAGAVAGYSLIWVLFWATVLGCLVQILSARLGIITGKNLARHCREEYPRWAAMVLWVMTELAIIGSDIQEVIGTAIALNILFGLPLYGGVLITAADSFTFLFINYFGIRKLESFFAFLITVMATCFAIEFFLGKPDAVSIIKGWVIPTIPHSAVQQAVGMVGAVIMPHNLFLHSSLVQSRKIDRTDHKQIRESNFYNSIESAISLGVSFFINMFIVAVFAAGFYNADHPRTDIGLQDAGKELKHRFGNAGEIVWALGLLAAGQSSTMTGTFAGQFVMQGFLDLHIKPWQRTTITRLVAIVPTVIVAVLFTHDLGTLNQMLNILQSIQLPFALLPLLTFSSSRTIVGEYALGKWSKSFFWVAIALILGINLFLVIDVIIQANNVPVWVYVLISVFGFLYISFTLYLMTFKYLRGSRYAPLLPKGEC